MERRLLPFFSLFLVLLLIGLGIQAASRPQPVKLVPILTGQPEYCLTCHSDLEVVSASHPVATFGCVRCHGGERLALDATLAHSSLRGGRNPSQLEMVEQSCGGSDCHSGSVESDKDHIARVLTSLHGTYAGALAAVRLAQGEQADLQAQWSLLTTEPLTTTRPAIGLSPNRPTALQSFDPASSDALWAKDFAQKCLNCHIGSPSGTGSLSSGCAACHSTGPGGHRLTIAISSENCRRCHGQGTYDPATLEFTPATASPAHPNPNGMPGSAPCQAVLDCVDCHTRYQVMGDGHYSNNQAEVNQVECRSCHGTQTDLPNLHRISSPEDIVFRLAYLNPIVSLKTGDVTLLTPGRESLWNIRQEADGSLTLTGKVSGQRYPLPLVQGSACQQNPEEQDAEDCYVCHTPTP